jgi:hypothetical protein
MADLKPEDLLAEVEDVVRTMPPRTTMHQDTQENFSWFGRAVAAIARWDIMQGGIARSYVTQFHNPMAAESHKGYQGLMTLLHEARANLRMTTLGPVNTAIGKGLVFDYFDELRKQIELAKKDVFFIDPYLDADFVSKYLPCVSSGVAIRLLGRERLATLVPAAALFAKQSNAHIEVRSAPNFHDRYLIVDAVACFQSGASFKDGGRTSPTTITQITDAFRAVQTTYEELWRNGKSQPLGVP